MEQLGGQVGNEIVKGQLAGDAEGREKAGRHSEAKIIRWIRVLSCLAARLTAIGDPGYNLSGKWETADRRQIRARKGML